MRTKDESRFSVIVDFVNEYFDSYGRSPSTREIESGIKISRATVQRYLQTLQERGEIEYDGHRGIITQYMRELTDTNRVQMGNSIPCGALGEVNEAELEYVRLPSVITGPGEFFLLRANGNSMIKAGIDDGDLVLIRKQTDPKPGDIVAFLYDNSSTTLKRYQPKKDAIWLCPENDSLDSIVIKGEDRAKLTIQGIAIKVIKDLK
jgi:repressor LexA